jgi:hypothetical protein
MLNSQPEKTTPENQTKKFSDIDFSALPSSDEFQNVKVKPQNRWFNSLMTTIVVTIGTCLGVIVGLLVNHFA